MPVSAGPRARSDRPAALSRGLIDDLYDFALTVTWDPDRAEQAVREPLRDVDPEIAERADLFHRVRTAAVAAAVPPREAEIDVDEPLPAPSELPVAMIESIALRALDGIEPSDRAALDLALRRRLDGDDLAHALGVSAAAAPETVTEAQARADRLLGHYVLARIGHDTCPRLRAAIGDPPPTQLGPLADIIDAHLAECSLCTDRRMALTSVTTMLDAIPARPAPDALHDAVGHLWLKEEVEASEAVRRRRRWTLLLVVILIVAAAGTALAMSQLTDDSTAAIDETPTTVAASLQAESTTVDLGLNQSTGVAVVRNIVEREVSFRVEVDVPWLTVAPTEGEVAAGGRVELDLSLDRVAAPEGSIVTTIRVRAAGGTTDIQVAAEIPKGPGVPGVIVDPTQLTVDGCGTAGAAAPTASLSATVAATAPLTEVVARTSRGDVPLALTESTWTGTLGPYTETGTVTLTVVATDTNGKVSTSPELTVGVNECPAPPTTTRRRR